MSAWTFAVTWVLHSTVLGLVALLLPAIFRLRDPRALASWWGYSAGGIVLLPVLPLFLPRQPAVPMPVTTFVETTTAALGPRARGGAHTVPPGLAWHACGPLVRSRDSPGSSSGIGGCVDWLACGMRSRTTRPWIVRVRSRPLRSCRRLHAARVPVVAVAEAGPCAFGWVDVCVLVPVALRERPEEERLAVYLHELAHIARADVGRGICRRRRGGCSGGGSRRCGSCSRECGLRANTKWTRSSSAAPVACARTSRRCSGAAPCSRRGRRACRSEADDTRWCGAWR